MSPPRMPPELSALIAAGGWPRGHFPAHLVLPRETWPEDFHIDLHSEAGGAPPHDDALRNMMELAENLHDGLVYRLAFGSRSPAPVELPWLDLEQAICIAAGAHIGDDTSIVLDFRTSPDAPRVVANKHVCPAEIAPRPFRTGATEWRVIAESWQDFLGRLTR